MYKIININGTYQEFSELDDLNYHLYIRGQHPVVSDFLVVGTGAREKSALILNCYKIKEVVAKLTYYTRVIHDRKLVYLALRHIRNESIKAICR